MNYFICSGKRYLSCAVIIFISALSIVTNYVHAAQYYKCIDARGHATYQDSVCPGVSEDNSERSGTEPTKKNKGKSVNQGPLRSPFVEFDEYTPSELDEVDHQFRGDVAAMLNRMASTIEKCNRGIFYPTQNRNAGNPANPEFSVSCGNVAKRDKITGYYFTWLDAVNGNDPYTKTSISYDDAVKLCREKSYSVAKFPDSARLTDIVFRTNQDGTANMAAVMKAKNSFDMTVLNDVRCSFSTDRLTTFEIF